MLAGRTLDEVEAAAIRSSYQRNGGVRRAMVDELGIAKSSLLRKLLALGLRDAGDLEATRSSKRPPAELHFSA